jgi:hypothetical protein
MIAADVFGALGVIPALPGFDSLPKRKRPHGVVAGQISLGAEDREHRPPGRPRKAVAS